MQIIWRNNVHKSFSTAAALECLNICSFQTKIRKSVLRNNELIFKKKLF